jgi:hypothetical protein
MLESDTSSPSNEAFLTKPKSFEEISSRPHFHAILDSSQHALSKVLTDYDFESKVQCGLKVCRVAHNSGFLVLTTDGLETNIGHVCGKNHFGAEVFTSAFDLFKRQRDRRDTQQRSRALRDALPTVRLQIADINKQHFGIKWSKLVRAELQAAWGEQILKALRQRKRAGDY